LLVASGAVHGSRWDRNRPVGYGRGYPRAKSKKGWWSVLLPAKAHNCFIRLALSRAMQPMPD